LLLRPDPWRVGLVALIAAIPILPLIGLAVVAGASALATTGRLMRWLPETGPGRAMDAAIAVAALALIGDSSLIAMLGLSGTPIRPLAVVAVAASVLRISASVLTLANTARARRASR
jgi:hypothetical protein